MSTLTLQQARDIIDAALAKATELKLAPMAIAVLDVSATLKAYCGQDNSPIMRPHMAQGKAYGALALGAGTRRLVRVASERPQFVQALNGSSGGRLIPALGGVLVRDKNGNILGAVGASGDTGENDEVCAVAGVESIGLIADVGS